MGSGGGQVDAGAVVTRFQAVPSPFTSGINRMIGSLSGFSGKLLGTAAVLGFFAVKGLQPVIEEAEKFEVQMAELRKLMSDPMARVVAEDISELGNVMPVAREELFDVAETAARLGIRGPKNIRVFTRAMAKMGVATDISSREAADAMARIAKQTELPIQNIGNLGSVINALANTMATSTEEIVKNMRRTAPTLSRLGLQAEEIAALGAAINEVSESARRGGTRLRRLGQTLQNPEKAQIFADALEAVGENFHELKNEDPRQLIIELVRAFGEGGRAANILASGLDTRTRQALAALSQSLEDGLIPAFESAQEEIKATTSLDREFEVFADLAASRSQVIQNKIDDMQRSIGEDALTIKKEWQELKLSWLEVVGTIIRNPLEMRLGEDFVEEFDDILTDIEGAEELDDALSEALEMTGAGNIISRLFIDATDEARKPIRESYSEMLDEVLEVDPRMLRLFEAGLVSAAKNVADAGGNLQDLRQEAGKIQKALSMAEVILNATGEGAAEAREKFNGLNSALRAQLLSGEQYVQKVREIIMEHDLMAGSASDAAKEVKNVGLALTESQINNIIEQVIDLGERFADEADVFNEIRPELRDLIRQYIDLAEAKDKASAKDDDDVRFTEEQQERFDALRETIGNLVGDEAMTALTKMFEDHIGKPAVFAAMRVRLLEASLEDEREELEENRKEKEKARKEGERFIEQLERRLARERDGVAAAKEAKLEQLDLTEAQERRARQLLEDIRLQIAHNEQMEEAEKRAERLQDKIDKLTFATTEARFDLLVDSVQEISDAFMDMLEAIVEGSESAGDALISMVRRFAREISEQLLQGLVFKALVAMFPGIMGAGNIGAAGSAESTGTFFGGDSNPFGGFAQHGARARRGEAFIVGEAGPELFVADKAGEIVPNDKLQAAGSGGGGKTENLIVNVNISNDVSAIDPAGVERVFKQQAPLMAQIVSKEVGKSSNLRRNFGR